MTPWPEFQGQEGGDSGEQMASPFNCHQEVPGPVLSPRPRSHTVATSCCASSLLTEMSEQSGCHLMLCQTLTRPVAIHDSMLHTSPSRPSLTHSFSF